MAVNEYHMSVCLPYLLSHTVCVCVLWCVCVCVYEARTRTRHDTGHGNMEVLEKLGQDAVGTII